MLFFCGAVSGAGGKTFFSTAPALNGEKKWRIGYYEGGDYPNYNKYLTAMVEGLMDLGWIEKTPLPENPENQIKVTWEWLSQTMKSAYVEFVKDACYSANWNPEERKRLSTSIIQRLNQSKDVDLMLAMGTWAGQDLANHRHGTRTMVISTSDPVGSGIISAPEDSGLDHVHARVDPYRWDRQIRIFHDTIKFKRLGVAYENSVTGKSYASIDILDKVAKERGFEVVHCYTQSDIADQEAAGQSVIKCFNELVPKVDAIYVTVQGGVNAKSIPELVRIANEKKIPTFSQFGSKEVRYGFLMSISRAGGFRPEGRFLAATAAQIWNGAKPRELNQIFEESPNIAINLRTAEIIGMYLYADLLAAADEIYREIEAPE